MGWLAEAAGVGGLQRAPVWFFFFQVAELLGNEDEVQGHPSAPKPKAASVLQPRK